MTVDGMGMEMLGGGREYCSTTVRKGVLCYEGAHVTFPQ